jgi:hypothetical protein
MTRTESIYKHKTLHAVQLIAMYSKRFIQKTLNEMQVSQIGLSIISTLSTENVKPLSSMSLFSYVSTYELSREVSANAGFPSDKAAALRDVIKRTSILPSTLLEIPGTRHGLHIPV